MSILIYIPWKTMPRMSLILLWYPCTRRVNGWVGGIPTQRSSWTTVCLWRFGALWRRPALTRHSQRQLNHWRYTKKSVNALSVLILWLMLFKKVKELDLSMRKECGSPVIRPARSTTKLREVPKTKASSLFVIKFGFILSNARNAWVHTFRESCRRKLWWVLSTASLRE